MEGNLSADEQVILRSSSWVQGDITAPRVVLEDGARFRGGVDMSEADQGRSAIVAKPARKASELESGVDKSKMGSEAKAAVTT